MSGLRASGMGFSMECKVFLGFGLTPLQAHALEFSGSGVTGLGLRVMVVGNRS